MIILPSFDGKNALINKIHFNTVWENEQFTLKEKIFRQINCFVLSSLSKYVAFTDFWRKRESKFP